MRKDAELFALLFDLLERASGDVHVEIVSLRVRLQFNGRRALDVLGEGVDELVDSPLVLRDVDFPILGRRLGQLDLLVRKLRLLPLNTTDASGPNEFDANVSQILKRKTKGSSSRRSPCG